MTFDQLHFLDVGNTIQCGSIRIDTWLGGINYYGRFGGTMVSTGQRVHVTHLARARMTCDELRQYLGYALPGVARFVAVEEFRELDYETQTDLRLGHLLIEELPPGRPLLEVLNDLDVQTSIRLCLNLARIVQRAHHQGIVLQGVKPDLVFIEQEGSATWISSVVPRSRALLLQVRDMQIEPWDPPPFSPGFCPPGDYFIPPADVYCLGLILSTLIEKRHPFAKTPEDDHSDLAWAMRNDERNPFSGDPRIGAILDSMLVRNPADRSTIDQIVAALERLQEVNRWG